MNKQFTGHHMTAILVGFFGVVIAVNLMMAHVANTTFGGLVVENSYVASQHFNRWLETAREVKELGWKVDISRMPDGRVRVTTADVPAGASLEGEAWHPLGRLPDRDIKFASAGAASYASTTPLPAGRWVVRLKIMADGKVWRGEQPLQ